MARHNRGGKANPHTEKMREVAQLISEGKITFVQNPLDNHVYATHNDTGAFYRVTDRLQNADLASIENTEDLMKSFYTRMQQTKLLSPYNINRATHKRSADGRLVPQTISEISSNIGIDPRLGSALYAYTREDTKKVFAGGFRGINGMFRATVACQNSQDIQDKIILGMMVNWGISYLGKARNKRNEKTADFTFRADEIAYAPKGKLSRQHSLLSTTASELEGTVPKDEYLNREGTVRNCFFHKINGRDVGAYLGDISRYPTERELLFISGVEFERMNLGAESGALIGGESQSDVWIPVAVGNNTHSFHASIDIENRILKTVLTGNQGKPPSEREMEKYLDIAGKDQGKILMIAAFMSRYDSMKNYSDRLMQDVENKLEEVGVSSSQVTKIMRCQGAGSIFQLFSSKTLESLAREAKDGAEIGTILKMAIVGGLSNAKSQLLLDQLAERGDDKTLELIEGERSKMLANIECLEKLDMKKEPDVLLLVSLVSNAHMIPQSEVRNLFSMIERKKSDLNPSIHAFLARKMLSVCAECGALLPENITDETLAVFKHKVHQDPHIFKPRTLLSATGDFDFCRKALIAQGHRWVSRVSHQDKIRDCFHKPWSSKDINMNIMLSNTGKYKERELMSKIDEYLKNNPNPPAEIVVKMFDWMQEVGKSKLVEGSMPKQIGRLAARYQVTQKINRPRFARMDAERPPPPSPPRGQCPPPHHRRHEGSVHRHHQTQNCHHLIKVNRRLMM